MVHAEPQSLLIGGGVSANSLLRQRAAAFAASRSMAIRLPEMAYCVDNAAMIAGLGHHLLEAGRHDTLDLEAMATTAI